MKRHPFNPKQFRGSPRVERTVAPNVVLEMTWNVDRKVYEPGTYFARRWEANPVGGKRRVRQAFGSLEAARAWQAHLPSPDVTDPAPGPSHPGLEQRTPHDQGPLFSELVDEFRRRHYRKLARGSAVNYDQQIRLHFQTFMTLRVHEITPAVIDDWLDQRKAAREQEYRPTLRLSFEKELSLLATILRFYDEYADDPTFKLPIKKRHRENALVVRRVAKKERTLSYEDFLKVREAALDSKYGEQIYVLMTLQFVLALRVGEAAALHWEDIDIDFKEPINSNVRVRRHIDWSRKREHASQIVDGLKNSAAVGRTKEIPLFALAFEALKRIYVVGGRGLIFKNDQGTFFEYRSLQHAYMLAFKRAGVEYGGTHNFRHGGCQDFFNRNGGDLALAGQLLGNEDSDTVKIYARRSKTALREAAAREWRSVH